MTPAPDATSPASQVRLEATVREFLADWQKGDFDLPRLAALDAEAMEAALSCREMPGGEYSFDAPASKVEMEAPLGRNAPDPCASHKAEGFHNDPCCPHCPIPAVQSGAVAWQRRMRNINAAPDHPWFQWSSWKECDQRQVEECLSSGGLVEDYPELRTEVRPLYADPQSEPLPGGVGETDRLIAVRDALLVAGGADPSNGVCRFSYWNLDKLNKAFDLALAALSGKEQG